MPKRNITIPNHSSNVKLFSVRFKIKKIWFLLKGHLHCVACHVTNIDYFAQQDGQINFCKRD